MYEPEDRSAYQVQAVGSVLERYLAREGLSMPIFSCLASVRQASAKSIPTPSVCFPLCTAVGFEQAWGAVVDLIHPSDAAGLT